MNALQLVFGSQKRLLTLGTLSYVGKIASDHTFILFQRLEILYVKLIIIYVKLFLSTKQYTLTFIDIIKTKISGSYSKSLEVKEDLIPWKVPRRVFTNVNGDKVIEVPLLSYSGQVSAYKHKVVIV